MIGHSWAVALLRRAVERGRLGHAYLFVGPPSVGKTALALELAGLLVCDGVGPRPCGACRACRNVARGTHPDVRLVERLPERRDITIDQVRGLEEEIAMAPYEARRKLFCIAGADALNAAAASALLKTLEEPPAQAILILAVADPEALPSTIRSRCQRLTLQPVAASLIADGLIERHHLDPDRAGALAVLARGRPGWAVQALGVPSLAERERAARDLVDGLARGGPFSRMLAVESWLGRGTAFVESRERALALLALLECWWRDALLAAQGGPQSPLRRHLVGEAPRLALGTAEIVAFLVRIQQTAAQVEASVTPRLALEHLLAAMPEPAGRAHAR